MNGLGHNGNEIDGWAWSGCGNVGSTWMGVVGMWPQIDGRDFIDVAWVYLHWQLVDGRGQNVATVAMDGWAWSGCVHMGGTRGVYTRLLAPPARPSAAPSTRPHGTPHHHAQHPLRGSQRPPPTAPPPPRPVPPPRLPAPAPTAPHATPSSTPATAPSTHPHGASHHTLHRAQHSPQHPPPRRPVPPHQPPPPRLPAPAPTAPHTTPAQHPFRGPQHPPPRHPTPPRPAPPPRLPAPAPPAVPHTTPSTAPCIPPRGSCNIPAQKKFRGQMKKWNQASLPARLAVICMSVV